MTLSVGCVFFAFSLAGALAAPIALRWKPRRAMHAGASIAAMALYYVLVFVLPFWGALTEILVVLAAAVAWSGPMAAIVLFNQNRPRASSTPPGCARVRQATRRSARRWRRRSH